MKKVIYSLIVMVLVSGTFFTSCKSPGKKEAEATESLQEAQQDLDKAKQENEEKWLQFRDEMNAKVNTNEAQILDLRNQMKKSKTSLDSLYVKNLNDLEKRNRDLKVRIADSKNDRDWETFQKELEKEANDIDKATKDVSDKINKREPKTKY